MSRRVEGRSGWTWFPATVLLALSVACGGAPGDFQSAWPDGIDRVWVGPEYFANRLADWRIRDGRLECVEARRNFPWRTVHLLTRSLGPRPGSFSMEVLTGPVDARGRVVAEAWSGFLIGAGGQHVDYRLTALVHHRPAEDGGLLAVFNGRGLVAFRNNSAGARVDSTWSIGGPVDPAEVALLDATSTAGAGFADGPSRPLLLQLSGEPEGGAYDLTLRARDPDNGETVSEAVLEGVAASQVDGGLALVSHLSPNGGESGFWFRDWKISGDKVEAHDDRLFGPILSTQYTVSEHVLKLTAQMGPLGQRDTRRAVLQTRQSGDDEWRTRAESEWIDDSYTIPFRVEDWQPEGDVEFRVVYDLATGAQSSRTYDYEGRIPAEPLREDEFVLAAFTGHKIYTGGLEWNHDGIWFPHDEVVRAVAHHQPDLLFFSGDQVYEGDLTPAVSSPVDQALLDYLYKWYRWCWAFAPLTRVTPTVTIPDDHDVYHGNIWGAGGRKAEERQGMTAQDSGGYKMPPRFVNAVHRTQTSHLPDPFDPTPVDQGISVYYTDLRQGGVSFAILADRQWKSSPSVAVPEGRFVNGWPQNPRFDPVARADVPGAELLGQRQLDFLRQWGADWSSGVWMKLVLSQTIFSNLATLPPDAASGAVLPSLPIQPPEVYPEGFKLAADADSNGWPQSGRARALREMRKAFALHVAGDQHLASTIQYGVDDWGDAGYALCVPSIGNTWPRRWFPSVEGRNRRPGAPRYTGDFRDGFGNRMTVLAVANPHQTGRQPSNLHDRAPGYGIVRLDRSSRSITIECWPRWSDPGNPGAPQYPGWPVTLQQQDNYGRKAAAYLPRLQIEGMADPVVQVIDESNDEIVYTLRIQGTDYRAKVFRPGVYTLKVGEPGRDIKTIEGIHSLGPSEEGSLRLVF